MWAATTTLPREYFTTGSISLKMLLAARTYFKFCFRCGWLRLKLFYIVAAGVPRSRLQFFSTGVTGVARGAVGALAPQGEEKNLSTKFKGESCKCTQGRARVRFFLGNGSFSLCFLRATTKRSSSTFWERKVHPQKKNSGYAYAKCSTKANKIVYM